MEYYKAAFLLLLFTFACQGQSNQPDSVNTFRVTLTDGSELIGSILQDSQDTVLFKTISGLETKIPRTTVRQIKALRGMWSNGDFYIDDPNSTRLLFSPTGECLKKRKGYFALYELFFPYLSYGVTDFLTISGGMSLFPGVGLQVLYFSPKLRIISSERSAVSVGALLIHYHGKGTEIGYVVGTLGSEKASFTGGLGWGVSNGKFSERPVAAIGGVIRVTKKSKFVAEVWFPPESKGAFIAFGIRFFGEHFATDIAFITYSEFDFKRNPFFPWLSFAYNF